MNYNVSFQELAKNAEGNIIKSAAYFLRESKKTSRNAQENELTKSKEAARLAGWIENSGLWFQQVDEERFIVQGAEQKVYLDSLIRFSI